MVKCKDGPYVCHEQHAEIVAALAADKQAADRATFDAIRAFTVLKDEVAALQAENERLRKAGDAMHLAHEANFNGYPYTQNQVEKAMKAWLAAKGVQS